MHGHLSGHTAHSSDAHRENTGLCGTHRPGSFRELTPHEFNTRRDLGVVVLKVPDAQELFGAFRRVFALGCSTEIEGVLREWPREAPLGLVCTTGECSARLAIRLSRQGYTVYHLAGGLHEWRRCCLPETPVASA